MLPASNRGAGMNIGFPDVCLTPAGPAVVPVPYPNLGAHGQATMFSTVVKVSMVHALNMGSMLPMTSGDEAGSAHPTIKGPSRFTMGNPIVSIDKMPAVNLTCPTSGNNMNNALGAVLVPGAVNVLYCRAGTPAELGQAELDELADAMRSACVEATLLPADVVCLRIGACGPGMAADVFAAVAALGVEPRALVLDLRGNPGGDLDAALALCDDFLPEGAPMLRMADSEGSEEVRFARSSLRHRAPLVVLVDRTTASAAELLAASLQANGRAIVAGERSYGKGSAQRIAVAPDGGCVRATVLRCAPGNRAPLDGHGVMPDVVLPPGERDRWLERAWALAATSGASRGSGRNPSRAVSSARARRAAARGA